MISTSEFTLGESLFLRGIEKNAAFFPYVLTHQMQPMNWINKPMDKKINEIIEQCLKKYPPADTPEVYLIMKKK